MTIGLSTVLVITVLFVASQIYEMAKQLRQASLRRNRHVSVGIIVLSRSSHSSNGVWTIDDRGHWTLTSAASPYARRPTRATREPKLFAMWAAR